MDKKWVVNASPLIVLGKIDCLPLLTTLTEILVIPQGVATELREGEDTDIARGWIDTLGAEFIRTIDIVRKRPILAT